MRNSDAVRIRGQFRSYAGLAQNMQPGEKVYAAFLPPPGNSCKLQIRWSGPLEITKVVNDAMVKIKELHVKNPRIYIAHRSKLRLAKKMGQKDTDPLFRLPRLPKDDMDQISEELDEFSLFLKKMTKLINLSGRMTARMTAHVHPAGFHQDPELQRTDQGRIGARTN